MDLIDNAEDRLSHKLQYLRHKVAYDINELSLLSGFSVSSLRRFVKKSQLKCTQSGRGGKMRFSAKQVADWLDK
jgi:hypothetical protein